MIPELQDNGLLPLGRHPSSFEEVEERFAPSDNMQRSKLWSEWLELTNLVHSTVGDLPAVWIGGSFVSSKEEPNDLDVVYILKTESVLALDEFRKSVLAVIAEDQYTGSVQPYFLYIEEMLDATPNTKNGDATIALMQRGYWDQLWSRTRDSNNPAYPARGYLEVIIDGYQ